MYDARVSACLPKPICHVCISNISKHSHLKKVTPNRSNVVYDNQFNVFISEELSKFNVISDYATLCIVLLHGSEHTKAVYPLVRSRLRLRCASVLVIRPRSDSVTRLIGKWM